MCNGARLTECIPCVWILWLCAVSENVKSDFQLLLVLLHRLDFEAQHLSWSQPPVTLCTDSSVGFNIIECVLIVNCVFSVLCMVRYYQNNAMERLYLWIC